MPYYDRRHALDCTLRSYEQYGSDVEVIIVDDGSPSRLEVSGVKVITLPRKAIGYSPVVPINIGVEYASHDLIAISLPEVEHRTPALYAMRTLVRDGVYVSARVWCASMSRWLASPEYEPPPDLQQEKPVGYPFNFCVMFTRETWQKVGGMSRAYRWGSHFDDTDFVHKLKAANIAPVWVDDVVVHTRDGARAPWVKGGWAENKRIFDASWLS